jgi:protein-tyrosine phosphatase
VRTILVVCRGNICRSPYLQEVLRKLLPGVAVTSAGFVGRGRGVPNESLVLAGEREIDLANFRSQALTKEKVRQSDLVVVMDANQARALQEGFCGSPDRIVIAGDFDPLVCDTRAIADPWNGSLETFRSSFDRLDRCAAGLASLLAAGDAGSFRPSS